MEESFAGLTWERSRQPALIKLMRILYFSPSYTPHDHRFLATIAAGGHETLFLRLKQDGQSFEDRPIPSKVQQLHWEGDHVPFRWINVPRLARAFGRILHEYKPDIIHAGPIQSCALIAALSRGRSRLLTMSWGYDLMQDVHRGGWWEIATRHTLRNSAFFISDAQVTCDKAVAYGMDLQRTAIFPWGIDLQHFFPAKQDRPRTEAFTLFSNRAWEPLYGVDVVARAFVRVAKEKPEVRLTLLGSGSEATHLRKILMGGNVMEQVYFGGKVSQTDLPAWYREADVYISASHVDGSSVSLMEALACGLPAIVSDIPGNREWVTNDHNGWLFRDGDADELAGRILHAIEHRNLLPALGQRSRAIAEERADWNKNSAVLLQTYETIRAMNAGASSEARDASALRVI